ncbi:MAG: hypothetical protein R3B90_08755 [Planctomycetaceae bacterium]
MSRSNLHSAEATDVLEVREFDGAEAAGSLPGVRPDVNEPPGATALQGALAAIEFDDEGRLPPCPGWRHPLLSLVWMIRGAFGLASLVLMLALIAAIPVVNFLALGYLLEVEGRVGRTGRLRDGFPLLGLAPRIGSIALGVYLWLLPLRLLSANAAAARIIEPGSAHDLRLHRLLTVAAVLVATHLCLALARGGSLGCFFRPIKNLRWLIGHLRQGDYLETSSREIRDFVGRLRLKHHFLLGVKGAASAFAWLLLPTIVYASVVRPGGAGVLQFLLGGSLLVLVFAWVPFLQARLVTENRFGGGFELRATRNLYTHAPLAWLVAVLVTYLLALPLYLFKAFVLPQDALWPITLIFIVSIYPARLVTGWAYHRAVRRRGDGLRSRFVTRWLIKLGGMLPVLAVYVFILYFTQFLGAHGKLTLYEHHAFLLPWPYLFGMQ